MKGKKSVELKQAAKELEQGIDMVRAPGALREDPSLILPTKIKVKVSQQSEENRMEE